MNNKFIIVFDFETDGKDPVKDEPVELAAVPIDPRKLEILKDSAFNTVMRPKDVDTKEYFSNHEDCINWHAKNRNCKPDKVVTEWQAGLDQDVAWNEFIKYCHDFNAKGRYPEPIGAGYNINNFDLKIVEKLCNKYKTKLPFSPVFKLDAMQWMWTWFENLREPRNLQMDTLRKFFGMESNGHEALIDVLQEAEIIVNFLKFQRRQAKIDKFKNSFS